MNLLQTVRAVLTVLDQPTKRTLILASAASVIIALFDTLAIALVLPLVTLAADGEDPSGLAGIIAHRLGDPDPQTLLILMTASVVILFILKDIGGLFYTWWLSGFKNYKRVELATKLLRHFLNQPYTDISRRSSAELLRTMNDAVTQFYGTSVFGLMTLVSNFSSVIAIAIALLFSAPVPSLALGIYFTLAAAFYFQVMKPRLNSASTIAAESSQAAYRTAFAALGGLKEAQLRGSQSFFVGEYQAAALRGAHAARTSNFIAAAPRYLLEILFILAIGILLVGGLSLETTVGIGEGLGVMALFVAAGLRALPAVTSLMSQLSSLRYGSAFLDIVRQEIPSDPLPSPESVEGYEPEVVPIVIESGVRFENVSFSYPGAGHPAIYEVNLGIKQGSSIAIVGGSGAGKTTLIDVLLGLHQPSTGRVAVDGRSIDDDLASWQRSLGYVPQEVFLREGTLAENVAFDLPADKIDKGRLQSAVERAQLSDLIGGLDHGLETHIGERGSRLSGGQRQRIGIARALYNQPQLLVLDEATSALDNETEHKVSEAIGELSGELTIVIVAHRLSTVRHVDNVVLLHEGRVEAIGPFDELRRSNDRFRRLVELGSLS